MDTLLASPVNDPHACRKDYPPVLADSFDEDKCDMAWDDARTAVDVALAAVAVEISAAVAAHDLRLLSRLQKKQKDLQEFNEAAILQIHDAPQDPNTLFYCYKKDNSRNKGWYYTTNHGNNWGICSSSCGILGYPDKVKQ